jgi:hypothetical protein
LKAALGICRFAQLKINSREFSQDENFSIEYKYLGETEGIGTFHFSSKTVKSLESLVSGESVKKVNSVFGEGANPRMRKIRDGLILLGVPADEILTHGTPRVIYGVQLIENLTEYLLGIGRRPRYFLKRDSAVEHEIEKRIVLWWMRRWVSRRILRDDIICKVSQHTLVRPITHGARVILPQADINQNELFAS